MDKEVVVRMPLAVAQQFISVIEGALQAFYGAVEAAGAQEQMAVEEPANPEQGAATEQEVLDVLANQNT